MNKRELVSMVTDEIRAAGHEPDWQEGSRHLKAYVGNRLVAVISRGTGTLIPIQIKNTIHNVRRNLKALKDTTP
jgi:hypothetical protein